MVEISTNLRNLRESARTERVEQSAGISATTVQQALESDQTSITAINATLSNLSVTNLTTLFNQRSITSSANLPIVSTDATLNVNVVTSLTVTVPDYASRSGLSLRFNDVGGTWATNNVTFNRTNTNTFDGTTSVVASLNYGWIEFIPMSDGVNSGYKIRGIYR